MANLISEYLVSLGIKDEFSGKLNSTLGNASTKIKHFAKGFSAAGGAVAGILVAANTAVGKFATGLVKADDELTEYAKSIGKSKEEAFAMKSALDAMGKTMEEIEGNETLTRTFQKLKEDAASIKPPDLSEGLNQVREIQGEFARLKQAGTYATQWIGHYLFKHLQQPLQKIREIFSGLNDVIIRNIPKWSEKIGIAMAAIVKVGMTVVRSAMEIFNAIKKVFDMVPKEIKILTAALAGFAMFIRAGPIGMLIAVFVILLLLLEDFFVFLDGGESLLGPFWQKLIDIWNIFKDTDVLDKLRESFQKALDLMARKIVEAIEYIKELYGMFRDSGSLQKFGELLKSIGSLLSELIKPIINVGKEIAKSFGGMDGSGSGKNILEWFIQTGLPTFIDLLTNVTQKVTSVVAKLNELGISEKIVKGLIAAFLGFKGLKILKGTTTLLNGFAKSITALSTKVASSSAVFKGLGVTFKSFAASLNIIGAIKGVGIAIGGLGKSVLVAVKSFGIFGKILAINPFFLWIAGIAALVLAFRTLFKNQEKTQEFINNISNFIARFIETAKGIASKIAEVLPDVIKAISEIISSIADTIVEALPELIETGAEILSSIANGITTAIPLVLDVLLSLLDSVVSLISEHLPNIIQMGMSILTSLVKGIISGLSKLIEIALKLIQMLAKAIADNLPTLISIGLDIITALINGIVEFLPKLINIAIKLIKSIGEALLKSLPMIIETGKQVITSLIEGIKALIPVLISTAIQVVTSLIGAILKSLPVVLSAGAKILSTVMKAIMTAIVNVIKAIFAPIANWFRGVWDNIKSTFSESDSFFGQVFALAMRAIEANFGNAVAYFKMIWENIKLIFSTVKAVLSGNFEGAYEAIMQIWDNITKFFARVIENIKSVFAPITDWFKDKTKDIIASFADIPNQMKDKFLGAVDEIKVVFTPIVSWFKNTVKNIIGAFTSMPGELRDKFLETVENIKAVFISIVEWFSSQSENIVDKFANIPNQLRDKFLDAVEKIKSAFAPIVDWFSNQVGKIKDMFGGIGDAVSGAKNWVGEKISAVTSKLPGYADGGIVTQHQVAEIAEGNKPEVIIPLTKPSRAKDLLNSASNFLGLNDSGDLSQKVDVLAQMVGKSSGMLQQLDAGLNQDSSYLNATNNSNVVNHYNIEMPSQYTINDSSGRPEATANAVDRTCQMRLRNLQGVLG